MTAAELNDYIVLALSVATLLGLMVAWVKGIKPRIANWRRTRKLRVDQDDTIRSTWPSLSKSVETLAAMIADFAKTFEERQDTQDKSLATIMANTWAEPQLSTIARFTCDNTGKNIDVNPAYAEMMRCGEPQLMEYAYKSYFRDQAFHTAFADCAREHRMFDKTTVAYRGDGTSFMARVTARPFPDQAGKGSPWRWYGVVKHESEIDK